MGGLGGADAKCNMAAQEANLGGIFQAWLSTGSISSRSRIFQSENIYVRTDGTIVANNFSDLIDESLRAPINVDEKRDTITSVFDVFTNTDYDGFSLDDEDCTGWTGVGLESYFGSAASTTGSWSNNKFAFCDMNARLYCFEDPTIPQAPSNVFVTNGTFDGNLGGITGADNKCNDAARASGLSGVYFAWLSAGFQTPASRFVRNVSSYVLTNGTTIANGFDDLISGDILAPINLNENGQIDGVPLRVWSNTNTNAESLGNRDCSGWRGTSDEGYFGLKIFDNAFWTEVTTASCDILSRLYCFEQPQSKVVFVTNQTYDGNLGGLTGGDEKCNSAAQAAGLSGTFRAWLSLDFMNPSNRFDRSLTPYVLLDNTTIATDFDDLIDGNIQAPIDKNEYGQPVSPSNAWTNTKANGFPSSFSNNCEQWSFPFGTGVTGSTGESDNEWTAIELQPCSRPARLYCFQQ